MKRLMLALVLTSVLGCDDFQQAMDGPGRSTTVNPTGIASSGDVSAVQNAAGGGAATPAPAAGTPAGQPAATAAQNQPAPSQPAAAQPAPAQTPQQGGSIIGKTTARINDVAELRKNPKIVEVENKVTGSDPFTASFSAYVSITSRASVENFKHQMDILKAASDNNSYPPFKEAEKLMKQLRIELAALPPYQLYGYDSKTGAISVFEDKAEKIRLYKLNNVPLDEADKKFDTP